MNPAPNVLARDDATIARCSAANWLRRAALVTVAVAATGCVGLQPATPPPSTVQLLSAGELELPRECAVAAGAVYRTLFEVQPDGRVVAPRSEPSDDGCVQRALREWVGTFHYAPVDAPTAVAYDWMAVTASRHQ